MLVTFARIRSELPPIIVDNIEISTYGHVKLLGVTTSSDLSCHKHVGGVYEKAGQRLYYAVLPKRVGITVGDIISVFKSVIHPVVEYTCQLWSSGLTKKQ